AGRGVVDLGDRDGQGRRVAEEVVGAMRGAVVADLVGERVRAVVVRGRRVLDGAVAVDRGRAVRRRDGDRDGEDLGALVRRAGAVAGQDVDRVRRGVLGRGGRVVIRGRGVVDLGDRDR